MAIPRKKTKRKLEGISRLDEFGAVDGTKARYRNYARAASKLNPKERAAWWRDVFRRDPDMLEFVNGDEKI
ncbi:MAG: hypothetical protein JSU93_07315 [Methanobacteriota archaeon]|nr:MAG: hypothetical protein JSU93_07315 [Euryarchaeota archaeon]